MYIRLAHFYLVLLICISPIALQQAQAQTKQVNKQATIQTSLGDIAIELYSQQAPATVANFIAYIKDAAYNGGDFYRVVGPDNDQGTPQISVIQGRANLHHKDFSPISLETTKYTSLKHQDGTLSMARGGPNTATQEFFICVGDQPALDFGGKRNPDGLGFAAFGRVISGMDIVRKIQRNRQTKAVEDPYIKNQILAQPIEIQSIILSK
ncbi:peptidylprolyl isomerase [Paraglaciecola chathamensis]|jgi:peptidyl-prolyl cis-trans isomerase A (cyclophilin A)|uniref:Peptidyl-prolyl cis-trans isomerase n=1 Tax=Paraglaciecola agarilytica NO2 TaxID=1125747 RepID=A0ABQ0I2K2_9ALTE|nr:peptidylprolyl isomerase [Paraglaciecola agarilytica]GAC03560.1 peptidyl-prolyl cis-trans isomerase B [Paraglaciecola agarilytica NO2]